MSSLSRFGGTNISFNNNKNNSSITNTDYLSRETHTKPIILAHHLSVDALPALFDFVSTGHVFLLKENHLNTIGQVVARFSSSTTSASLTVSEITAKQA